MWGTNFGTEWKRKTKINWVERKTNEKVLQNVNEKKYHNEKKDQVNGTCNEVKYFHKEQYCEGNVFVKRVRDWPK